MIGKNTKCQYLSFVWKLPDFMKFILQQFILWTFPSETNSYSRQQYLKTLKTQQLNLV